MRYALIILGLLVAIGIGVRLLLPDVPAPPEVIGEVGSGESSAPMAAQPDGGQVTDAEYDAAVSDRSAAPASPRGLTQVEDPDRSPLQAEQRHFEQLLASILARAQLDGDHPDMGILIAELEQLWDDGEPIAGLVISILVNAPDFGMHDSANAQLWLERSADAGSLTAQTLLAVQLLEGDPSQPGYDPARSVDLMEGLVAQGVMDVAGILLKTYSGAQAENGYVGDPVRAAEVADLIWESGDGRALLQLGGIYSEGYGGADHLQLAVDAYASAGEHGAGEGYVVAAAMLIDCRDSAVRDPDRAAELLERQIETYDDSVQNRLMLANAYAASGRWAEAIAEQQRVIAILRTDPDAQQSLIDAAEEELVRYQGFEGDPVRDCT